MWRPLDADDFLRNHPVVIKRFASTNAMADDVTDRRINAELGEV